MSYDDWSDAAAPAGRRLVLCLGVLALAGFGLSSFALLHQHGLVAGERNERRSEVTQLRQQVDALQARDASLTGRLNRREAGTARLAARVLRSVFTVEAGPRLGSAFAAWSDDGATYLVTANHVVAGESQVTLVRRSLMRMKPVEAMESLVGQLAKTKSNAEFLGVVSKFVK